MREGAESARRSSRRRVVLHRASSAPKSEDASDTRGDLGWIEDGRPQQRSRA
jgi:hypothetical protein